MKENASAILEDIVRLHGKKLFNLAYRICGDEVLAEDLLQESFLNIYKAIPGFEGRSSYYTWAYKITLQTCLNTKPAENRRNQAVTALRKKDEQNQEEYEIADEAAQMPEDAMVQKALIAEVREKCHYFMLFKLTDDQRIPLLLKDLFDFSYSDIAYVLDISEDVVRSRLSRARENLKRFFRKRCSWIDPSNPCSCEEQGGYALHKYPSLLRKLSQNTERPEYNKMIADQIGKQINSEEDIISTFPHLDYKGQKALKKLFKKED